MRSTVTVVLLCLILPAATSVADDLLACVDPDVRQALLVRGYGDDIAVNRSLPDVLRGVVPPQGFEFIGSSVVPFLTNVAYKTTAEPDDAAEAAAAAFEEAGWEAIPGQQMARAGFVSQGQPTVSQLCKDDQMVSVMARSSDRGTFVNLNLPNAGNVSCDAMRESGMRLGGMGGVHQYLPKLTLPQDATANVASIARAFGGVSSSGGNRTARTEIPVQTGLSADDLLQFFGKQLEDQNWAFDSGWSGRLSVGAVWSARPTPEINLVGILDIVVLDDGTYHATFRATQTE